MKPLAYIDFDAQGAPARIFLGSTGWLVPGNPGSPMPAILDRLTLDGQWSAAKGDPVTYVTKLAARLLGGKATILQRAKSRPGAIH